MTITIAQLLDAEKPLNKLTETSFSGRKAFTIARMLKKLQAEEETYNTSRIELIKKYADKDESGEVKVDDEGNIHVSNENMSDFNKEFTELITTELEVDFQKIPIDWLDDVELTPIEVQALEPFIEE